MPMVMLLVALSAVALTGVLAPAASAAPDAAQIDAFLSEHGSPMTGSGSTFVAEGKEHGIDPAFLVAISGAETSFGQYLYSENGDLCTYNAFNWFYGSTWPASDFTSWNDAIGRVAEGLAGDLYYGAGLFAVSDIAPRYCPDGTANWIANVTAFMTALGGDPADTRLVQAVPVAPDALSGVVALRDAVAVRGAPFEVGDVVRVRFAIINRSARPVALDGIILAVRGPTGASADMVSQQPLTLRPGGSRAVTASWAPTMAGRWHGWVEVQQDGGVGLVSKREAFSFRVTAPRVLQIRR
jgi:hypothetical protein